LSSTPEVTTVLLVGAKRPFYLERPALFSTFADPPKIEELMRDIDDAEALRALLLNLGVSHVLVDWDEFERDHETGLFSWSARKREVFERFLGEGCVEESEFGRDVVYRITWS
jgi:hypothetical protein